LTCSRSTSGALGLVDQCLKRDELVVEEREHVLDQLLELGAIAQTLAHSDERVCARRLDHFGEALHRRRQMRDNGEARRFVVGDFVHRRASMQQRLVTLAHFFEQNAAQTLEFVGRDARLHNLLAGGARERRNRRRRRWRRLVIVVDWLLLRRCLARDKCGGRFGSRRRAGALFGGARLGLGDDIGHEALVPSEFANAEIELCAPVGGGLRRAELERDLLAVAKGDLDDLWMLVVGLDSAGSVEFALRTRVAGAQHGGSDLVEIAIEEVERGLAENDPELLVTIDHHPLGEPWRRHTGEPRHRVRFRRRAVAHEARGHQADVGVAKQLLTLVLECRRHIGDNLQHAKHIANRGAEGERVVAPGWRRGGFHGNGDDNDKFKKSRLVRRRCIGVDERGPGALGEEGELESPVGQIRGNLIRHNCM
jgi:hypothetical protein